MTKEKLEDYVGRGENLFKKNDPSQDYMLSVKLMDEAVYRSGRDIIKSCSPTQCPHLEIVTASEAMTGIASIEAKIASATDPKREIVSFIKPEECEKMVIDDFVTGKTHERYMRVLYTVAGDETVRSAFVKRPQLPLRLFFREYFTDEI